MEQIKRLVFPISIALTVLFFGFVFYKLFLVSYQPFPKLTSGKYIGSFPGEIIGAGEEKVYFTVDSDEKSPEIQIVIYRMGWGFRSIEVTEHEESPRASPLIVTGPEGVLRFEGHTVSAAYFSGKVKNISSGDEADWVMYPGSQTASAPNLISAQSQVLALKAEENNLEMQIAAQKINLESTAVEHNRLSKAVLEGPSLEQKAESRFSAKQAEIEKLKPEISKVEKNLAVMQASLEVARAITQRGRLTTMAREGMQREYRSINFKLSGESRQNDAALLSELSRAQEALALQQEISLYDENAAAQAGSRREVP